MKDEYYRTHDLGEAAYLLYIGVPFMGSAETSNNRRHALFFKTTKELEDLVDEYYSGEAKVIAKDYSRCSHQIAKELKNPIKRTE